MFDGPFRESMIRLAKRKGLIRIKIHNLRRFAKGRHRKCDDKPYGGGPGMVMMAEPVFGAIDALKRNAPDSKVVLLSPQGERFTQARAWELSHLGHLIVLCGHYEGIDERVREFGVDLEFSVGDFVTTGGEIPAMGLVDSVVRLVPGVVGNEKSIREESFQNGLLDHPHYTRPSIFRGHAVPAALLSGDHEKVTRWRAQQAYLRTRERRPDLLAGRMICGESEAEAGAPPQEARKGKNS